MIEFSIVIRCSGLFPYSMAGVPELAGSAHFGLTIGHTRIPFFVTENGRMPRSEWSGVPLNHSIHKFDDVFIYLGLSAK